jgi:hypothetical protein
MLGAVGLGSKSSVLMQKNFDYQKIQSLLQVYYHYVVLEGLKTLFSFKQ